MEILFPPSPRRQILYEHCFQQFYLGHPRRPRGSQSGREKGRNEGFQIRAKEPLGTDSHRAISKVGTKNALYYVSVKSKLQHAPPGQPPGHLTFLKIIVQIPPTRAKMPFKCPTLGSIQVFKCPHPGDISQAQK